MIFLRPHLTARVKRLALMLVALASAGSAGSATLTGEISAQARWFLQPTIDPRQSQQDYSVAGQFSVFHDYDDQHQRLALTISGRADSDDGERSQFDIGELTWRYAWRQAELTVGIDKVFWGVTEALHLIDIVNQTNRVDSPDGESKLGQPMIRLSLTPRWGAIDVLLLPVFREQRLPGSAGRLRGPLQLIADAAEFESGDGRQHMDVAIRYSHFLGPFEFALSHFAGQARTPLLRFQATADPRRPPTLSPYYFLTDQTGLELTLVTGNWLWKLEAVSKRDDRQRYFAATGGFEYTQFAIAGTSADVGLILEYQYDGRDALGLLQSVSVANDDIVLGARFSANDFAGSELLLLLGYDRESSGRIASLEASRRLGQSWRASLEARFFSGTSTTDALSVFADEDYWQFEVTRFF